MLTAEGRARLRVVLVGARNPQNIGAAARAMQDFGFGDLRVVNEFVPPFEAARLEAKSAVGAQTVMAAAQLHTDLLDAIQDCHVVVGTTAIGGREPRLAVQTLQAVAPEIIATLNCGTAECLHTEARVALLFGSEKTGLTNAQLSYCGRLVTIPMFAPQGRHLSMNLGQSVAVCLYELGREGFEGVRQLPDLHGTLPTEGDRERLVHLLLESMQHSGYARRFPSNARIEVIRGLARQLGQTRDEAFTWMGFLRTMQSGLGSSEHEE